MADHPGQAGAKGMIGNKAGYCRPYHRMRRENQGIHPFGRDSRLAGRCDPNFHRLRFCKAVALTFRV